MSVLYGLAVVEGGKAAVLLLANLLQLGSDEQWCGWAGGWSITNWQTGTIHEAAIGVYLAEGERAGKRDCFQTMVDLR
jgi:hypothetical protein